MMSKSPIQFSLSLISETKERAIKWVKLSDLKTYLKQEDKSIIDFACMQQYSVFLQTHKFIYDCEYTYVAEYDNILLVFSKSKYTFAYRLDYLNLNNSQCGWNNLNTPISMLLRIRNVIGIVTPQATAEDCSNVMSIISSACPV